MRELNGRTAFITGGAAGIGLAIAEALGREGVRIMLADVDVKAMEAALDHLHGLQIRAAGVRCDVTDRTSIQAAAEATLKEFGKVHLTFANAGVGAGGEFGGVRERDWDWVFDVNLKGVVGTAEIFVPLMESHGEGGHLINTASMAGMLSPPGMEPYSATKFAVVALSEGWRLHLFSKGITVSVLCPGFVQTQIHNSYRNRPGKYGSPGGDAGDNAFMQAQVEAGIRPELLAARVVEAVKADEFYIFTHPGMKDAVEMRFGEILTAFDTAAASPALKE